MRLALGRVAGRTGAAEASACATAWLMSCRATSAFSKTKLAARHDFFLRNHFEAYGKGEPRLMADTVEPSPSVAFKCRPAVRATLDKGALADRVCGRVQTVGTGRPRQGGH